MDETVTTFELAQGYFEPREALYAPSPQPGASIMNPAALEAAIATAQGGEVFQLASGAYGAITISRHFDIPITLRSDGDAQFNDISIGGLSKDARGGGVILDKIDADGIWIARADGVAIINSAVRQIKTVQSTGIQIERNHLHDGHFALRIENSQDFRIIGNVMERAREDTMRVSGNSFNGLIQGNVFLDNRAAKPMHGDHLQMFGIPGHEGSPHNIMIEQNLFHDDARGKEVFHLNDGDPEKTQSWKAGDRGTPAPAQGIFVKDGSGDFVNITIRRNLLRLSMTNGIYIGSGKQNYLIEENIVVPVPDNQLASIRLAEFKNMPNWNNAGVLVTRNITPRIIKETPESTVTADNYLFEGNPARLFSGITNQGGGNRPEDYRLAANSPIPRYLVTTWLDNTIAVTRATLDAVAPGE